MGIRPPVPPDDDRGRTEPTAPRERPAGGTGDGPADEAAGRESGAGESAGGEFGAEEAAGGESGAGESAGGESGAEDLDEDDLDDFDPTAPPADLTADELHDGGPEGAVVEWRVDPRLAWTKLVVALVFLAGPWIVSASALSRLVGLVAGGGLALWGLRDVMAPVRLRADSAGVRVVSGFAGHRELRWRDLERVRLDSRSRLGLRSELLEIDAGESVHFFSRYDLNELPVDALGRIREFRGLGSR